MISSVMDSVDLDEVGRVFVLVVFFLVMVYLVAYVTSARRDARQDAPAVDEARKRRVARSTSPHAGVHKTLHHCERYLYQSRHALGCDAVGSLWVQCVCGRSFVHVRDGAGCYWQLQAPVGLWSGGGSSTVDDSTGKDR